MSSARGRYWIEHWEPEDPEFWESKGRRIATKNLRFSIFAEHIEFAIWTMWSVLVLFLGKNYGFSMADKFLLTSTPAFVGSCLRVPYTFAVAKFGGRNWTIFSAVVLIVPCILVGIFLKPGVSLNMLLVVAAIAGLGGGSFASSMTNINTFYPERLKGWALGLNAGGGNLGVAVVQLVGLGVIAWSGVKHPEIILWIYIPLIVVASLSAALFMNNLSTVRNDTGAAKLALKEPHNWIMSVLYIGTFGSFIGYSFAFGLVLQNQFHYQPLQAVYWTFLGPLIGSIIRPVGGRLADKVGGSIVTFWTFLAMAIGCVVVIVAGNVNSFPLYLVGFMALFVFSGVGNGSIYKMIPAIFTAKAAVKIAQGAEERAELLLARRMSGAVIGLVSAIGAMGGVFINVAFRASFLTTNSGTTAVAAFLVFYAACFVLTWAVYLRPPRRRGRRTRNSRPSGSDSAPGGAHGSDLGGEDYVTAVQPRRRCRDTAHAPRPARPGRRACVPAWMGWPDRLAMSSRPAGRSLAPARSGRSPTSHFSIRGAALGCQRSRF